MHRLRLGVGAAAVPHVTARVTHTVAIEQLAIPAALRDADAVTHPWYRREVGDDHGEVVWIPRASNQRDDTVLVVVAIDPAEPAAVEIDFVKRRFALVRVVEIPYPATKAFVLGLLQQMPLE